MFKHAEVLHRAELWGNLGLKAAVVVGLGGMVGLSQRGAPLRQQFLCRLLCFEDQH